MTRLVHPKFTQWLLPWLHLRQIPMELKTTEKFRKIQKNSHNLKIKKSEKVKIERIGQPESFGQI
jgi:hypothetical protein